MLKKLFNQFLIMVILITFPGLSCQSDKTRQKERDATGDQEELEETYQKIDKIKQVYNLCPSPAEMLSIIDMSGFEFNADILNSADNLDRYVDFKSQGLNTGIYITDLAYAALFNRHKESVDYLELVSDLARKIKLQDALGESFMNRAKMNIQDPDSVFNISNEAFIKLIQYTEKMKQDRLLVLITTGAFIESLYLSVQMVQDYQETNEIITQLAGQKYSMENLFSLADELKKDPFIEGIMPDLTLLKNVFDKVEVNPQKLNVNKDKSNKLVISGGDRLTLSESGFGQLKKTVSEIRTRIILNQEVL